MSVCVDVFMREKARVLLFAENIMSRHACNKIYIFKRIVEWNCRF